MQQLEETAVATTGSGVAQKRGGDRLSFDHQKVEQNASVTFLNTQKNVVELRTIQNSTRFDCEFSFVS